MPARERRLQPSFTGAPAARAHGRALDRLLTLVVLLPIAAAHLWSALVAPRGLTGHEPRDFAIAQSLWLYHTLAQHQVLYNHDFFSYYPHLMSSHALHRDGHLYPLHPLGLPLLLLPGFALAGLQGALLIVLAYEAIDAPCLTARRALALGLLLAFAPWLHVKLLVIVGAYMLWA